MTEDTENPGLYIVVIEDDDAASHLIQVNLKRTEIEADFLRVNNGERAVQLFREDSPEYPQMVGNRVVVLLDIRMPKLDGIQVLQWLKNNEKTRKLPVIMLTTSDRATEVDTCYSNGCSFYIKKQVDYPKFVNSIKSLAAFIKCCELPVFGGMDDE